MVASPALLILAACKVLRLLHTPRSGEPKVGRTWPQENMLQGAPQILAEHGPSAKQVRQKRCLSWHSSDRATTAAP